MKRFGNGINCRKRRRVFISDPKKDERAKKQWLKENQVKKLPPGWSRYGYEPG